MRRREFIAFSAATVAWPVRVSAQEPTARKRKVVAYLSSVTHTVTQPYIDSFLQGMRDLGEVEGRDFDMLYRFSDGYQDRIPSQTEEVIRLKPDVILATAVISAVAARKLTSTIPIVSAALADAVDLGLIKSEARPGGNVTGIEPYVAGLPAKQMEIAREISPAAKTIGLLTNIMDPKVPPQVKELEAAAKGVEVTLVTADISRPEDVEGALQILADQRVDVVIVLQSSLLLREAQPIAELALKKRLLTVYGYRAHVAAGGLVSYGVDLRWCFYRTAYFVDKILHGTSPGDLPIEFPTKMLMTVNLKTARTLGLTVPPALLNFADEVIE
jgi:putative tryptophan/tyrosine transport system substrate-binding protein